MSYVDLARKVVSQLAPVCRKSADDTPQASRKPWSWTPEEEAAFCRVIEKDQGLPPGSVKLYTPQEFRRLFGDKWPNDRAGAAEGRVYLG